MSKKPQLNVINGGKDMLEVLDDLTERVKSGHIHGLVVSTIEVNQLDDENHLVNNMWAFNDDLQNPWSMMVSTVDYTHQCLMDV